MAETLEFLEHIPKVHISWSIGAFSSIYISSMKNSRQLELLSYNNTAGKQTTTVSTFGVISTGYLSQAKMTEICYRHRLVKSVNFRYYKISVS